MIEDEAGLEVKSETDLRPKNVKSSYSPPKVDKEEVFKESTMKKDKIVRPAIVNKRKESGFGAKNYNFM